MNVFLCPIDDNLEEIERLMNSTMEMIDNHTALIANNTAAIAENDGMIDQNKMDIKDNLDLIVDLLGLGPRRKISVRF